MDMTADWLLLVYALPAKQARARVQAWRRLQRIGAVSLKNSAYVLPCTPEAREDFEWIRNEILAIGGQAMVLLAGTPDAATRNDIVGAFRSARSQEFEELAREASRLLKRSTRRAAQDATRRQFKQAVRRLRERFDETARIDFFGTPERDRVADLLARIEHDTRKGSVMKSTASSTIIDPAAYRGKTWLTRPRPGVDRMSSAWLIRRFIDPDAKFIFGDPSKAPEAIPFDTFGAEFGHHGTQCTFETLCNRFGIADAGVLWIGRIVHDLDLKQNAYNEADATTVGRLVEGLRGAHADDLALLTQGIGTFEALYQSYARPGTGDTPQQSGRRIKAGGAKRKR
jgi:hypothetical protein